MFLCKKRFIQNIISFYVISANLPDAKDTLQIDQRYTPIDFDIYIYIYFSHSILHYYIHNLHIFYYILYYNIIPYLYIYSRLFT